MVLTEQASRLIHAAKIKETFLVAGENSYLCWSFLGGLLTVSLGKQPVCVTWYGSSDERATHGRDLI
jgi:hypothetical protein